MCKSKIKIELFLDIKLPEVAYLLGYFWADGHIREDRTSKLTTLTIIKDDFQKIQKCFKLTGNWNFYDIQRKNPKYRLLKRATSFDKNLYNFLLENDFKVKSYVSPRKILSKIPENLKSYFYLGWLDGDGYIRCTDKSKDMLFASRYDYDWSSLEELCKSLDVFYKIKRKKCKFGRNSTLQITSTRDTLIFGNYIYKNYEINKIGLPRKYKRFLQIVKKSRKMKYIKKTLRNENGDFILEDLVGQTFGMLTVLKEDERGIHKQRRWFCKCVCGEEFATEGVSLKLGKTKSCGCYRTEEFRQNAAKRMKENMSKHGDSRTKFHWTWTRMINSGEEFEKLWKNYSNFKKDNYQEFLNISDGIEPKRIYFLRKDTSKGFIKENVQWKIKIT